MKNLLLIFVGGGTGSLLRYGLSRFINSTSTSHSYHLEHSWLISSGCFLIGFIIFYTERYGNDADQWRLLLATGLCGGFTTFSTFSLESAQLISDEHIIIFILYAAGSIILGTSGNLPRPVSGSQHLSQNAFVNSNHIKNAGDHVYFLYRILFHGTNAK